jgi:hypothetical protein
MNGETWMHGDGVTQAMLDTWPVWECSAGNGLPSSLHVVREIGDLPADDDAVRPLRMPGMNEQGEIKGSDIQSQEHFERVREWQYRGAEWPWTTFQGGWWYLRQNKLAKQLTFRPAIFAGLDKEPEPEPVEPEWKTVDSRARKGLLCAIVNAGLEQSTYQENAQGDARLVVEGRSEIPIVLRSWDWGAVWPRIYQEDRYRLGQRKDTDR